MQEKEATSLANKVLAVDNLILVVDVISTGGVLLGVAVDESRGIKFNTDKEFRKAHASRVASLVADARADSGRLSDIEAMVMIRDQYKAVMIPVTGASVIVVAVCKRFADDLMLETKIRHSLGLK